MAMSEQDLKRAFREVAYMEFADIPDQEGHVFSEGFVRRMERLIRRQRTFYWKYVNTAAKRAAVIFVALAAALTLSLSVRAIREPIVRFVTEIYETFMRGSFAGDTAESITKAYAITELPEGFTLESEDISDTCNTVAYRNERGWEIEFAQLISDGTVVAFDRENGKWETRQISGIEVSFCSVGGTIHAFWTYGGYFFHITCIGEIDTDTVEAIIRSVE